jgi:4-hydroxybenzoate polyprenyltransferase
LRTLLILGRTSNLPTVWSNCLAGWWLAGGGSVWALVEISVAVTLLYLGGMFFNDAFDADFDRQYCKMRPIPAGVITESEVWRWSWGLMSIGVALLICLGWSTALFAICLTACIIIYDAIHKKVWFGPVVMAGCRFFVYLIAASVAKHGVTGNVVWCALGLASYIVGLSYLARKESVFGDLPYWSTIFLTAPLIIGWLIYDDKARLTECLLGLVMVAWVAWALHFTMGRPIPKIGATISRLLAGIILVDLLVVADKPAFWPILGVWFVLALLFQRIIPAT